MRLWILGRPRKDESIYLRAPRISAKSRKEAERCSKCGSTSYCVESDGGSQADRPWRGCPRGYDQIEGVGPGVEGP